MGYRRLQIQDLILQLRSIKTGYFIGCRAKMIKYTPIIKDMADTIRTMYSSSGEYGKSNDSVPKNLAVGSHAETGRNSPQVLARHKIPAIHRQILNSRIYRSFQ